VQTIMQRSKAVPLALLLGCNQPATGVVESDAPPALTAEASSTGQRPSVGHAAYGDDITELVRAQNQAGSEPAAPTRKGVVSPTPYRPQITRTDKGFEARIPNSTRIPAPAIHGGRLVTGGISGREMYGLDPVSGQTVWALNLSDDGPSEPSCEDGICVFNTYSCTTFAVEAATGKHLWSWYLGSPQLATTVVSGGMVFASYPDPRGPSGYGFVLGAFSLKTGEPKWRRWIDGEVNSAPVAHDGHIYLASRMGTLYQFREKDGAVESVLRNRIATPPVLTERGVLFGADPLPPDNNLLAAQKAIFPALENGAIAPRPVAPKPRPLVVKHRLVSIDKQGAVVAKHHLTGRELWSARLDGLQVATAVEPLSFAGESILLATANGSVVRIEPESGSISDTFPLTTRPLASQPIAVDGWLYAGTHDGALVAYDTGKAELSGWPMMGGTPDRQGKVGDSNASSRK
jgi:outer membrane protein assembly factor BamB